MPMSFSTGPKSTASERIADNEARCDERRTAFHHPECVSGGRSNSWIEKAARRIVKESRDMATGSPAESHALALPGGRRLLTFSPTRMTWP
jgi:hypothetical protein